MSPVLRVGTNLRIGRLLDGDYLRLGSILRPGTLLAAIPLRFGDIPPSLGLSSAAPRQASPRMAGVSRSGGKAEVRRRRPFLIPSAVSRRGWTGPLAGRLFVHGFPSVVAAVAAVPPPIHCSVAHRMRSRIAGRLRDVPSARFPPGFPTCGDSCVWCGPTSGQVSLKVGSAGSGPGSGYQ